MFDVSGLTAVELMYHYKGVGRYQYLDQDGTVIARQCKKCLDVKSIEEYSFSTYKGNKKKYHSECKPCNSKSSLAWNKANPEKYTKNVEKYTLRLVNRTVEELLSDMTNKYPDGVRRCTICKELKDFSMFYIDKFAAGGLGTRCRSCNEEHHVQWVQNNPQRAAELNRITAERFKARSDEEIISDQNRIHPDGIKSCKACAESKTVTDFYQNKLRYDGLNPRCAPCAVIYNSMRRRQRRPKYWIARGIPLECYMCRGEFEEVEHVVPLAGGGLDVDENTLPACRVCNGAKSDIPLEEFVQNFDNPEEILQRVESYGVTYRSCGRTCSGRGGELPGIG